MCARMNPLWRLLLGALGAVDYYTPGSGWGPKGPGTRLALGACSAVPMRHIAPFFSNEEVSRQVDVAAPIAVLLLLDHLAAMHDLDQHGKPAARHRPVIFEPNVGDIRGRSGIQGHDHPHDDQPLLIDPELRRRRVAR